MSSAGSAEGRRAATERLCRVSLLAALALVLGYLESMIPLPAVVPGFKLGLGNMAVLIALATMGAGPAFAVAFVKVLASGLLFGSPAMMLFSAGGTLLALGAMCALVRICGMGLVAVSVAAAVMHNMGQLLVAALYLGTPSIFSMAPALGLAGCVTGLVTGVLVANIVPLVRPFPLPCSRTFASDAAQLPLRPGVHIALVGANGSGKSTFLRTLAQASPSCGRSAAPLFAGGTHGQLAGGVGLAVQDAESQIVAEKVADEVAFGPENYGLSTSEIADRVKAALEKLHASALADVPCERLSGGQRQRVVAAGLLALDAQLLCFDEVTAHMDWEGRRAFAATVRDLCAEGKTVLTATQLVEEALGADYLAIFENGSIVACETPDFFRRNPEALVVHGVEFPLEERLRLLFAEPSSNACAAQPSRAAHASLAVSSPGASSAETMAA